MRVDGIIDDLNGVIFDMDGLLVNSEELYEKANQIAARNAGLDLPADFYETLSGSSLLGVQAFFDEHFDSQEAIDAFIKETDDMVWQWVLEGQLKLRPGVQEALELFRRSGVKMAVASSNYENFVQKFLTVTGISKYFEFYLYYGAVPNPKPAPDIYQLAQERLGIPTEKLLIFEDSTTGVQAAKNAGIKVIMVPFITRPTAQDQIDASRIMPSFYEFIDLVK
ncbi:hydrolase [Amylolactobacillus amylotrophicus DSM 20534]|uniref:Hydrolase n=3 Tax=Amylolactobacillus TaxID=2767876 RepID=A0A0R1YJL2_9LACO|nr:MULTISPECIES: HAD family phosphatase [Amylolactobacillus]APT19089.1 hydrolase [Amylolactobacillus amylophilus DSM 20533 = JCM 1125]KRK38645.1 hydrolase [Amylolactobacillus amylotrophicus DSM 20534]KRM42712.1 hydrolase [Amylolactobacillus amylophilus DSM 20533 = JCM 1125]GED79573.1 hydrolase [Amylolactobacillus amylophilus]